MSRYADVAVLLDAPALPTRAGAAVGRHTAGLAESLDWAKHAGFGPTHPAGHGSITVVRRDAADPDTDALLAGHPAAPGVIHLPARRPGDDPEGWVLAALKTRYVLTLHPGVTPDPGTLDRALAELDAHRHTAAITGGITRLDGAREAHALPTALHRGAALLRTKAIHRAGGFSRLLPPGGAGDLDLTCRLMRVGYYVRRYEDLAFTRHAWPEASVPTTSQAAAALRDALIVAERYLPRPMRKAQRRDLVARAAALSADPAGRRELAKALQQARRAASWERQRGRSVLHAEPLERLLAWDRTRQRITDWAVRHHPRRVVLAGWHPNLYAAFRAARRVGLHVLAVADDAPLTRGRRYRGVPVLPLREAITGRVEGVIVTDQHPATAPDTAARVAARFEGPVLTLHAPKQLGLSEKRERFTPRLAA